MINQYENKGLGYLDFARSIHEILKPKTYFEIGTFHGGSLEIVSCPTIAVDPFFNIQFDPTRNRDFTLYFQMASDYFFSKYDPSILFQGKIDVAFLDGLHEYEATLRDFINTEKHCGKNSIVTLHDCLPFNSEITTRVNTGGAWTGDVWKIIPILKRYRKDIDVFVVDAAPTGLVCCTNLNPGSTILQDNYKEICKEWRDVELEIYGYDKFIEEAGIISTAKFLGPENIRKYFYL